MWVSDLVIKVSCVVKHGLLVHRRARVHIYCLYVCIWHCGRVRVRVCMCVYYLVVEVGCVVEHGSLVGRRAYVVLHHVLLLWHVAVELHQHTHTQLFPTQALTLVLALAPTLDLVLAPTLVLHQTTPNTHTHNYSQPTHTIISNPSPSTSPNIRSSTSPKISPASCSAAVARSHRTRHTDIH